MLMAAAMTAAAQSYTITAFNGEHTISEGEVLEVGYEPFVLGGYTWDPVLKVQVEAGTTLTVSAAADADGDIQAQFCGVLAGCTMLKSAATPEVRTNTYDEAANVPLRIDIARSNVLLSAPMDVAISVSDGTITTSFTVRFTNEEQSGIQQVAVNRNIRVSGRTIHYSVDSATNITLYTISGQSAISRRISGSGTLSLAGLPAGVYIYRAGKSTGKLVIK